LKPSYVYGDNVASLFLAQNNSVGQRTKHIDIRHRFMSELVESKQFELRHVCSEENTSDVNSKNMKIDTHTKMVDRLYNGLVVAEVDEQVQDAFESSKEDVGSTRDLVVTRDQEMNNPNEVNLIPNGSGIGTIGIVRKEKRLNEKIVHDG